MLFNSWIFIGLVAITFTLYYQPCLARHQVLVLVLSSLTFYSYYRPVLVLLLLFSVGINIVSSYYVVYGPRRNRKLFAILGVVLNLSILAFFKYSPLLAKTFFHNTGSVGEFLVTMPLPIGISFFTFQGISLVIDVYKEKHIRNTDIVPESFLKHSKQILFFKGFFPQLISGPIVKAHEFIPQIGVKTFANIPWESVFKSLLTGYYLKMVIADNLKDFTFWISFPYFQSLASLDLIVCLFGFSCQIFADFAGYSLIAIGLARLFGYHFKNNFNFPYIALSFRDFWKRWHISLSTFLMEYLYIPLGGNRKGVLRTYVNLMIVMLLGGLWHGAAWSYAIWGGVHGLALAIERVLSNHIHIKPSRAMNACKCLFVFGFVTLAWLLFKLPDFSQVLQYLQCIIDNSTIKSDYAKLTYLVLYSLPVILYHCIYLFKSKPSFGKCFRYEYVIYGGMLFLIIVNSGSAGAFIYFQF